MSQELNDEIIVNVMPTDSQCLKEFISSFKIDVALIKKIIKNAFLFKCLIIHILIIETCKDMHANYSYYQKVEKHRK